MRLNALHEENLEGIGFRNSKNLGRKIATAMRRVSANAKKNLRTPAALKGRGSIELRQGPGILASPVPKKPRHRKFFGMDKPQIPY